MSSNQNKETLHIGGQISQLQRFHRRFITAYLAEHNLTGAMHTILYTLASTPGVSQDFLSVRYNMDKGIIARQCKSLEERGLIIRKVNENDRRQYCLYLTEQGNELIPFIQEGYRQWTSMITKGFSDTEKQEVNDLLLRMTENCRDELGEI